VTAAMRASFIALSYTGRGWPSTWQPRLRSSMAIEDIQSKQELQNFVQKAIRDQPKGAVAHMMVTGSGLYSFGVKTITWPGGVPDLTGQTISHGLGVDPAGKVWLQVGPPNANHFLSFIVNSTDATTVTFQAHCITGNPALNSTDSVIWLAMA
jgi:hypothetical protein